MGLPKESNFRSWTGEFSRDNNFYWILLIEVLVRTRVRVMTLMLSRDSHVTLVCAQPPRVQNARKQGREEADAKVTTPQKIVPSTFMVESKEWPGSKGGFWFGSKRQKGILVFISGKNQGTPLIK